MSVNAQPPLIPGSGLLDGLDTRTGRVGAKIVDTSQISADQLVVVNFVGQDVDTQEATITEVVSQDTQLGNLTLGGGTISSAPVGIHDIVNKDYIDNLTSLSPPPGSLQYSTGGGFGGSSNLLWDSATQTLTLDGTLESSEGSQLVLRTPDRTVAQPGTQIVLQSGDGGSGEDGGGITLGGGNGEGGGGITLEGGTALGNLSGGGVLLQPGNNLGSGLYSGIQIGGGLQQISQWDPKVVGSVSDPTNLISTSLVAVQGNYAYVVTLSNPARFTVVNISNPTNPLVISSQVPGGLFDGSGSSRVMVLGRYVYTVSPLFSQLTIWDVSDPNLPVIVGTLVDAILGDVFDFDIVTPYLFVGSQTGNSVSSLYIGNPQQPTLLDTLVDATDLSGVRGIRVNGRYAYIVAPTNNKFTVVDVSNPSVLTKVGILTNSAITSSSQAPQVQGSYAYIPVANTGTIIIVDVSDPTTPTIVTQFIDNSLLAIGILTLAGGYGYAGITTTPNAIIVLNLRNPILPTLVGEGTTGTGSIRSISLQGRYAYIGTGILDNTLWVMDILGSQLLNTQTGPLVSFQTDVIGNMNIIGTLSGYSSELPNLQLYGNGDIGGELNVFGEQTPMLVFYGSIQGAGTFYGFGSIPGTNDIGPVVPFDIVIKYLTLNALFTAPTVFPMTVTLNVNGVATAGTVTLPASPTFSNTAVVNIFVPAGSYIGLENTAGSNTTNSIAAAFGYPA